MQDQNSIPSDDLMVQLLINGDATSFGNLYDAYSGAIFTVIRKIISEENLSQDVLQDAFIKIWERRDSYDKSKGRLFTWMLNVARNTAIDALRNKHVKYASKIQNLEDNVSRINRERSTFTSEDLIGVSEMVDGLQDDQKAIIDLSYFKGYTQEEVAKELNIPLGTVKTRTRTALQVMRAKFKTGIN